MDLNGTYTLRLVVTNSKGVAAEDRITLSVGRVISNIFGGTAKDSAGEVFLEVPEHALDNPFRVMCVDRASAIKGIKYKKGQRLVGAIYEIRPQGEVFTRDSRLSIKLPEDVSMLTEMPIGIYAYNTEKEEWEYFPGTLDKEKGVISADLRGIPEGRGLFAILEDGNAAADKVIAGLSSVNYNDRAKAVYSSAGQVKDEETLISYDFEDGNTAGWSSRNGHAGAKLELEDRGSWLNKKALKLVDSSGGGSFASTIISEPFDAKEYPKIAFDYKMPEGVKVNIMAKMDGKWYDIEFTDDPKKYQNINMEKIGKIAGVNKDGRWHKAEFDLYRMLKSHPSLRNQDKFIIDEIIMADWNEDGFMKLVYGNNPKGAYYAIDNFTIKKDTPVLLARFAKKMSDYMFGVGPDKKGVAVAYAKPTIAGDLFIVNEYDLPQDKAMFGAGEGVFHGPGPRSAITASVDRYKERGYCLKLDYNVPEPGDYAGYYRLLKGSNISAYNTLNFWIKGERSGEKIFVGLKNTAGEESKVNAASFAENGINRNWQKISIPLAAFVNINDRSSIENLSFIFEENAGSKNGSVYIDDISFDPSLAFLVVADFSDCTDKTIWGKGYWTFNTRTSNIYTGSDAFGCLIQYHGVESKRENISWAGWGIDLDGLNVTGYETLALHLKRIHGTERPNLYLADSRIERYVDLEDYMTGAPWEDVRIPLKVFAEKGINLSDLKKLTISFEWEKMDGAIYVDDIAFVPFSQQYKRAE